MTKKPKHNILITGAGSGLGRALSLYFAQQGHSIFVTDLDPKAATETLDRMGEARGASTAHALDVTSDTGIQQLLSVIGAQRIDVLINNAGVQHLERVEEFPVEKWELVVNVILKGAFLMTRAVLPRMRTQGFGRIIQIGSVSSQVGSPYRSAYVAAKHALLGFSKSVALETGDVDITINTICPIWIRTPLVDGQLKDMARLHKVTEDEVIQRLMIDPMPKKAFITYEEIAAAIEYLMSHMARNVTAQTITIDGGYSAR